MLVIVEGPDGSGKTTVINELCKHYNFKKVFGIHKDSPLQHKLWKEILRAHSNGDVYYIMDRCFLSDWVYRMVMNDGEPYMTLSNIVSLLEITDVTYVFCNTKNAYNNAINRGEDYVTDEQTHERVTNSYNFVYDTLKKFTNARCLKYDYTKDNYAILHKRIRGVS